MRFIWSLWLAEYTVDIGRFADVLGEIEGAYAPVSDGHMNVLAVAVGCAPALVPRIEIGAIAAVDWTGVEVYEDDVLRSDVIETLYPAVWRLGA